MLRRLRRRALLFHKVLEQRVVEKSQREKNIFGQQVYRMQEHVLRRKILGSVREELQNDNKIHQQVREGSKKDNDRFHASSKNLLQNNCLQRVAGASNVVHMQKSIVRHEHSTRNFRGAHFSHGAFHYGPRHCPVWLGICCWQQIEAQRHSHKELLQGGFEKWWFYH